MGVLIGAIALVLLWIVAGFAVWLWLYHAAERRIERMIDDSEVYRARVSTRAELQQAYGDDAEW